MDFHGR